MPIRPSLALVMALALAAAANAEELPQVTGVEFQPLAAQAARIVEALDALGQPLSSAARERLAKALKLTNQDAAAQEIQEVFDPLCLVGVEINPEGRVKVAPGEAAPALVQHGWRAFLVKVHNQAGLTSQLRLTSPNAAPLYTRSSGKPDPKPTVPLSEVPHRWLDASTFDDRPLTRTLSGLPLEYRVIQLYSRDAGRREARLKFDAGQGTQDLASRSDVDLLFQCEAAAQLSVNVKDVDGKPTTASFVVRDALGRVCPSQSRRLAPDFFFHPQVYRADGESILLAPGTYTVEVGRGPEYLAETRTVVIPPGKSRVEESFQLKRWVHPAELGWYSGDHHVHAAGCSHYESPTEGVTPEDMMRHIVGENLDVGCVLAWGPCWYAQKSYFGGKVHPLSTPSTLMRYDVEVSGFPSSGSGHLCLLRLTEDDYPGTTRIEEWPSWDLPVLKWGKSQGGVVGYSHSGWGLAIKDTKIPSEEVPPFDGIGANEYIVDVVHDAVDFISAVDTPAPWELNIWYHTLNCGYRCRISGETDFPCIYDEKVGLGRSYVNLGGQKLDFDTWVKGIKEGRSYVSDGKSHLVGFKVNGLGVGEAGSETRIAAPGKVKATARVFARLEPQITPATEAIRSKPLHDQPYWDVERARVGATRKVPVELIVNGQSVARREVEADGSEHDVEFDVDIDRSSWVALRVYPSSHTNPVFVVVDGKPIRASRKSAEWCLKSVDQCWSQKQKLIRAADLPAAQAAYDVARKAYASIRDESAAD
ncbi:CehA/McbA family metallohydrolase [Isosphaeraceae bacterium EP7]